MAASRAIANVRILRDNVVVHTGKVGSLRRFKDDVSEVRSGMECGITLDNFSDVQAGDIIEGFVACRGWLNEVGFNGSGWPIVGVLTLELRIEHAHSLKEKRHVVKSLKDRLRGKFNVRWPRSTIRICITAR